MDTTYKFDIKKQNQTQNASF